MDNIGSITVSIRRHRRSLRLAGCLFALLLTSAPLSARAAENPLPPIIAQIDGGHFKAAQSSIEQQLAEPNLSPDMRSQLLFQRERMRRILLDFTLSEDQVEARVRQQIPDLSEDEFAQWNAAGLFEHQVINGRRLYFKRAPGNLFRLSAKALARRAVQTPMLDGPMESLNATQRAIFKTARDEHRSSVLPQRVHMTQTLTVDADAVPAGEIIRAWIPYPQAIAGQQQDISYLASVPAKHQIAPKSAMQRTVYLEKPAQAGQKTVFSVTYEVTLLAQSHAIDPDKVLTLTDSGTANDVSGVPDCADAKGVSGPCSILPVPPVATRAISPELAPYLSEHAPHIVFTDALRAFSRKVVGDEKNPYRIAQKLFAAVDRIPWAGAREYSTISNISDYALHAGHADCGQQTLLLMTLLRLNGIPTRWQSGMVFSADGSYSNIHDWGYLYLAPYGWIPMDVTTGRLQPKPGDDPALEWFYLGGLDNYRIAFNNDEGRPFEPAKQHFRSDTVDSQRGEAEWRGGNIYFDQLGYDFDWQVQATTHGRSSGK